MPDQKNTTHIANHDLGLALDETQFQQLKTAALKLKAQLEVNEPEKFEEVRFAAQHAVEELSISFDEAVIQVLMGAIMESLDRC